MKLIAETCISYPSQAYAKGEEFECDDAEAKRLIAKGYARPLEKKVKRQEAVEEAVAKAPEKAVKRKGKK